MDELSRSLPEYLWLTNLALKGATLAIDGETLQEQAIPNFMKNLEASEFVGAVQLIQTQQKPSAGGSATITTALYLNFPPR